MKFSGYHSKKEMPLKLIKLYTALFNNQNTYIKFFFIPCLFFPFKVKFLDREI